MNPFIGVITGGYAVNQIIRNANRQREEEAEAERQEILRQEELRRQQNTIKVKPRRKRR
ncbi:MAG: hypothetical protein IJZ68_06695 [Bacteroidaceae bacterium]|nr:hypothetical protein [Bacteroidaceae bacterium]